jgi:diguanylate cyclase (GGDEF)-like protein
VARVGGDEILAVLDGIRDLDDAARIAEKIRASVSGPIRLRGSTLTSTLSIGVTLALPGEPVDDAIARADDAMFRAKRSGRDRVVAVAAPG